MIDYPDLINGIFEFAGAGFLSLNALKLRHDKKVRGVHWAPTAFFAGWGLWNLFYYPNLDQWFSLAGGIVLVAVNLVWFALMMRYWRN